MDIGIVLSLMGGLGFFLYGMKLMSDGLEKAAGAKLRGILEFFTKNQLMGTLVGIVSVSYTHLECRHERSAGK